MVHRSIRRAYRGSRRRIVSPQWRAWLAENLLRGVDPRELVEGLVGGGVPAAQAKHTVSAIVRSPLLAVARREATRSHQLGLITRLLGGRGEPLAIPRVPAPAADEFFSRYWSTSTPAIFVDIVPRWRAHWSPTSLRERFGEAMIEACTGRDDDPQPDANWDAHRRELPLAEYIDRMLGLDRSNDLYLIANNRNTARPQLRALWDDVVLPEGWFDEPRLPRGSALWLGPAGTVTPLHHDTSNILFCQIHGRKRIVLAPPWATALLDTARGVYNARTPGDLADEGIESIELTLGPGEALFLPVGWWHDVRALDVSVSLAINAFARDNRFEWYRLGGPC
ncbi:MAG: cupin-like domain-containing protein [Myxococcota bacterium]